MRQVGNVCAELVNRERARRIIIPADRPKPIVAPKDRNLVRTAGAKPLITLAGQRRWFAQLSSAINAGLDCESEGRTFESFPGAPANLGPKEQSISRLARNGPRLKFPFSLGFSLGKFLLASGQHRQGLGKRYRYHELRIYRLGFERVRQSPHRALVNRGFFAYHAMPTNGAALRALLCDAKLVARAAAARPEGPLLMATNAKASRRLAPPTAYPSPVS
jgi:hypothetical protein